MLGRDPEVSIVPLFALLPVCDGVSQLETLRVHHPQTGDVRADEPELLKVKGVRVERRNDIAL